MSSEVKTADQRQPDREVSLIEQVVASLDACDNPRLKVVMVSLVQHLHTFIRDVRLTETEWRSAIEFLARCGHITDDRRQEFILLSDVLGASMQTVIVNNPAAGDVSAATVIGPFFAEGSPAVPFGGDICMGAEGEPCWVEGTVTDDKGGAVAGARIEVWEADANGMYDVQYDDGRTAARAHLYTDEGGRYAFWAVTPTAYPIPHDGPVGELLELLGRSPMRAAHLHFMVTHPEHKRLVTHVFVRGDELLESDAVFGVTASLVQDFKRQPPGTPTPDHRPVGGTWSKVTFDIVLALSHD